MHNLQKLLDKVISEYGENEGFKKPTISWSKNNRIATYGEYQYWINNIIISRSLNSPTISDEAIKSVIYHEYLHQKHAEHTAAFHRGVNKFKNYKKYKKEMDTFIDGDEEIPIVDSIMPLTFSDDNTLVVLLPHKKQKDFLNAFHYSNFNLYMTMTKNICVPPNMTNRPLNVIWMIKENSMLGLIAWSKNTFFLDKPKQFKSLVNPNEDFVYQAYCQNDEITIIYPSNCICVPSKLIPNTLIEQGYCFPNEFKDHHELYNFINTYDYDSMVLGLTKDALEAVAPLKETNYEELIRLSQNELDLFRFLWIANLALKYSSCYATHINRAMALSKCCAYDEAKKETEIALKLIITDVDNANKLRY